MLPTHRDPLAEARARLQAQMAGTLKRAVIEEGKARVKVPRSGVVPVDPSKQVSTIEGRLAWKAWKAREARTSGGQPPSRASAKRASDGRSDREVWYQHYKCWGIRRSA